jgi:hypothetical protein
MPELNEPRLVITVYGWRDFWWRHGHNGPGWSISPAHHRYALPGGSSERRVPFSEREGLAPARHILGLCVKRLRPWRVSPLEPDQAAEVAGWLLDQMTHPGGRLLS